MGFINPSRTVSTTNTGVFTGRWGRAARVCTSIRGDYSPATGFVSVGDALRKYNLHSRWALVASVSSATLMLATMAQAADAPTGETVSGPTTPVSEVIVTAEKRPVNV